MRRIYHDHENGPGYQDQTRLLVAGVGGATAATPGAGGATAATPGAGGATAATPGAGGATAVDLGAGGVGGGHVR
jgi:hypothetical protein